jgi:glycine hydroxymethyltransferase
MTAQWINEAIENYESDEILENIAKEVKELCIKFQPPGL